MGTNSKCPTCPPYNRRDLKEGEKICPECLSKKSSKWKKVATIVTFVMVAGGKILNSILKHKKT